MSWDPSLGSLPAQQGGSGTGRRCSEAVRVRVCTTGASRKLVDGLVATVGRTVLNTAECYENLETQEGMQEEGRWV